MPALHSRIRDLIRGWLSPAFCIHPRTLKEQNPGYYSNLGSPLYIVRCNFEFDFGHGSGLLKINFQLVNLAFRPPPCPPPIEEHNWGRGVTITWTGNTVFIKIAHSPSPKSARRFGGRTGRGSALESTPIFWILLFA